MPKPDFLRRSAVAGAAVAGVALAAGAADAQKIADAQSIPIRVTAEKADSALAPLSLVLPQSELTKRRVVPRGAAPLSFQSEAAGVGKVKLTFLAPALKKGESKLFVLVPGKPGAVEVKEVGKNAEIKIAGQLFTRYDTTTGPNKPYLYPIQAFGGKHLTRRWPLEDVGHEEKDHPHHRGLWFTHGEMNGVDFWTEVEKKGHPVGKTVNTGYSILESGAVYGRLGTTTDWITHENKTIAKDTREIIVTPLAEGNVLLDFSITVTAVGGPLHWGDTKEGTFALRVPEIMKAEKEGKGTLESAEGLKNAAVWGKPSPWHDYWGPIETGGETFGIAIFDSPANLRYPTTWHSRTYGLYATNPFGLHDFDSTKKTDRHAGDLMTPEGEYVTFRYRVLFHKGDTRAAKIAESFNAWATPPKVELAK
ncbi:PmoA family protein [Armatimonas sp.]|uniref:DUF6807 domain-containing protein n=1 Tax=Armatimonas sp. TaxID=1872638 RepID=UPI003751E763